MIISTNQNLTLTDAKKAIERILAGMVGEQVQNALDGFNTHNLKVEAEAQKAEEVLDALDKEAEEEQSSMVKLMWPTFRATKVQEIEAIRASKKEVPSVEALTSFFLSDTSGRILHELGLEESVPTTRQQRNSEGDFKDIWGSHFTHNGNPYMVVNYRIIPDSLKEQFGLKNADQWVIFQKNQDKQWYKAHIFTPEKNSPSKVVKAARSFSAGRELSQTNLDGFVWKTDYAQNLRDVLGLNAVKLNAELAK